MATLKETVNDMVFKLRVFSSEVTRVSLEVGTKGQLGGQAVVLGVEVRFSFLSGEIWRELMVFVCAQGTWKELVRLLGLTAVGEVLTLRAGTDGEREPDGDEPHRPSACPCLSSRAVC